MRYWPGGAKVNPVKLRHLIELHEGKRPYPYVDTVGKLTIGVGHNLTDRGLTEQQIDFIYEDDVRVAMMDLDLVLPSWRALDEVRQMALVDMSFQLGRERLSQFVMTLGLIQSGDYEGAADAMLDSLWASQTPIRVNRLAQMMRTGVDA